MRKLFSFLSLAAILLVTACEDVEIPASLEIPQESQEYFYRGITFCATSAEGSLTVKVSFTSSLSWTASIVDADGNPVSWLSVSPTSGAAGDTSITITAQDNPGEQPRSAMVTVTCGDIVKSFNVTQAGKPVVVDVTEVSLNKTELELETGQSEQLTATVKPDNATDKTVTWSSSDTSVAIVEGGKVAAIAPGEAVITATAGNQKAECKVTVIEPFVEVTEVKLDHVELELDLGQVVELSVIVKPDNATDKTVTWSSSDALVATVEDGKVTGVAPGEAVITASAGNKKDECKVIVYDPAAIRAVDMGLSVKWANMNLGASAPEDFGDYYAWGETEPYYSSQDPLTWKADKPDGYAWTSYKWCNNGEYNKLTKYCPANKTNYWDGDGSPDDKSSPDPEDDAAHVQLGGKWRMPTDAEWTKLRNNCTWKWTSDYNGTGVAGMTITSNKTGKSIFLPAAGYRWSTKEDVYHAGSYGEYWSTIDPDYPNSAYYRYFSSAIDYRRSEQRYEGLSIRPVSD